MSKVILGSNDEFPVIKKVNTSSLSVTPSTSAQSISAPVGSGFCPVYVSAVTPSIDKNIKAENIKKGVAILGVLGEFEESAGTGLPREVVEGRLQFPESSFAFELPPTATDVIESGLNRAFNACPSLTSVNLSSLTTVSGAQALNFAFYQCPITNSIDLSNLVTVSGIYAMDSTFGFCSHIPSVDLSSLTVVSGSWALRNAFTNCTSLTSIDLSSLTTISGSNGMNGTFNSCTSLTSVDLSNLTTISGSNGMNGTFKNCKMTSIDLSSLTTISGSNGMNGTFNSCTSLTSVDLSNLTTISSSSGMSSTFKNCKMTSMSFPKLSVLSNSYALRYAFQSCTSLTSVSFPALTSTSFSSYKNQFNGMLSGVTGCTVHFPSNLQSVIGSWTDVTGGFGGTNTTVLFDLPATT